MICGAHTAGALLCGWPETNTETTWAALFAVIQPLIAAGYTPAEAMQIAEPYSVLVTPYAPPDVPQRSVMLYPGAEGSLPVTTINTSTSGLIPPLINIVLEGYGPAPLCMGLQWKQELCCADQLTFAYPSDAAIAPYFKRPNRLLMYDFRGYLIQAFKFPKSLTDLARSGGKTVVNVTAKSFLEQLEHERVREYNYAQLFTLYIEGVVSGDLAATGGGHQTFTWYHGESHSPDDYFAHTGIRVPEVIVSQIDDEIIEWTYSFNVVHTWTITNRAMNGTSAAAHVKGSAISVGATIAGHARNLLNHYQLSARKISVGSIAEALDDQDEIIFVDFNNKSVYDCLYELWVLSGKVGAFVVTPNRQFIWAESLNTETVDIRLGLNLQDVTRTVDESNLCTRLYPLGGGVKGTRAKLTDNDAYSEDYLDTNPPDPDPIPQEVIFETITDSNTLGIVGQKLLDRISVPDVSYTCNWLNLSPMTFSPLILGATAHVYDEVLGIDTLQLISSITISADNIGKIECEFAKNPKRLEDIIASIMKRLDIVENKDVIRAVDKAISSGQSLSTPRKYVESMTARELDLQVDATGDTPVLQFHDGIEWQSTSTGDSTTVGGFMFQTDADGNLQFSTNNGSTWTYASRWIAYGGA